MYLGWDYNCSLDHISEFANSWVDILWNNKKNIVNETKTNSIVYMGILLK